MDVQQYLDRIFYAGPIEPTLDVLTKLQQAHLLNVPFENFDIQQHIKINLAKVFNKIVGNNRGGFCYELNGLFYCLLKETGFNVNMVSARVYNAKTKTYSPEYDHLALVVEIDDERYLTDVGFGEFAFTPLKIEAGNIIDDPRGVFKIEALGDHFMVLKEHPNGDDAPEYMFTLMKRDLEEFYPRCHFHETSRDSHFTQKLICSLPTQNGRITLTGNVLKLTHNDSVIERALHSKRAIQQVLQDYFFSSQRKG
ncbi:MAG: arylamine N-acetyltransferase [Ginsengibacter sp.]